MDEQILPQHRMIKRIRKLCRDDPRVQAAMLYGSFAEGRGDRFSDIDCILYFQDEVLPDLDRHEWAEQVAPLLAFYRNEFENWAAIYENLVRVEYHFDPASQILSLQRFRGVLSFPSTERVILLDRTGELAECLRHLSSPPDLHESMKDVLYLQDSLCNWLIFGTNVLARGEIVRAGEILRLVQDNLLRLSRMDEAQTQQWITPSRNFEVELSLDAQHNFRSCTSGGYRAELFQAYWNSWIWGQTLLSKLAGRIGGVLNEALLSRVGQHMQEFIPPEFQASIRFITRGADLMGQSPLPGLFIRQAVRQDLPAVLELIRLLETDGRVLDMDSAGQMFARFHSYPNCTLYVAEYQDKVIAMFVLLIMDNLAHFGAPSGILEDLVVKESFQGKGVGKYMLDFVMQVCREAGCYKLVLSSSLQRTFAHRFYANLGFRQYGYCFEVKFQSESSSGDEANG